MADLLLKKALIYNKRSKHHGKRRDILIKDGIIADIKSKIDVKADQVIISDNLCVSGGWLDIGCFNGEPGYEYREDLDSLRAEGAAGGYTHLAPFPTTQPTIDSKGQVQFLLSQNVNQAVQVLPIAALSQGRNGTDIAELLDLKEAGAIAFSDGVTPTSSNSLLDRGLQYLKGRNRRIIQSVQTRDHHGLGQVNEGKVSVHLGLEGLPAHIEVAAVQSAIASAAYTQGDILIHNISLAASLQEIEQAKKSSDNIIISVACMNLVHSEENAASFDVNMKVIPPLRSKKDITKLQKAVDAGQINIITSNHTPLSKEDKDEPFGQSKFGAVTLSNTFSVLRTLSNISIESIIDGLSDGPYLALNILPPVLEVNEKANLTIFDPDKNVTGINLSKSKNSPYDGQVLTGKVVGIVNFNNFKEN